MGPTDRLLWPMLVNVALSVLLDPIFTDPKFSNVGDISKVVCKKSDSEVFPVIGSDPTSTTSSLPSPLKSPTASGSEVAPEAQLCGFWKVPSPLPSNKVTFCWYDG